LRHPTISDFVTLKPVKRENRGLAGYALNLGMRNLECPPGSGRRIKQAVAKNTSHSVLGHIMLPRHHFYVPTELGWTGPGHGMAMINCYEAVINYLWTIFASVFYY
jgi:hypothetical protein